MCSWVPGRRRAKGRTGGNERETENPNVCGYAAKSLVRIVDFPEPEGPEMTIGRWRRGMSIRRGEEQMSINLFLLLFL